MAEWHLAGSLASPVAKAGQPHLDEPLACGSSTGLAYDLVRPVVGEASVRSGTPTAPHGVPDRRLVTTTTLPLKRDTSGSAPAIVMQPAAPQTALVGAASAASAAAHAAGGGGPTAGNTTAGLFSRPPPLPPADSGLRCASQASAATRDDVVGALGAPATAPAADCSTPAPTAPAAGPQGASSSCDKASDKGSDAGAGSGSGGNTSGSGGDTSGSGGSFEQQSLSDEQAFSAPTQPNSGAGGAALSGKEQESRKRRLANRESAQRVRQRRRLEFDEMHTKLATMVGDTERLVARIAVAEVARDAAARQLAALQGQLVAEHAARAQLLAGAAPQVAALGSDCPVGGVGASAGPLQPPVGRAGASPAAAAAAGLMQPPQAAAAWPQPAPAGPHPGAAVSTGVPMGIGSSASVTSLACAAQRPPAPLGYGPLTTGMPHPPPALHVRRQPHCCIVSSGWAPPAPQAQPPHPAAAPAGHPGAAGAAGGAKCDAGAPPRSVRLRRRQQQAPAPPGRQPQPAAAAAAHARLASQLQRCPALAAPQLQQGPLPAAAVPRRAAGGGGAIAAAALMPPPAQPAAASLGAPAGSGASAGSGPVTSAFAAYCFLPFAD